MIHITMSSISPYISFPNYRHIVRSNKVMKSGTYSSIEDVVRVLYELHFHARDIRNMYDTFHESSYLRHTLQTVRACILQIESACCTDKIYILENLNTPIVTERVIYIKMYDFGSGKRRRCTLATAIYTFLTLFSMTGIAICLYTIQTMITSS